MRKQFLFVVIAFFTVVSCESRAQNSGLVKITLEDLYKNNVFRQKGINAVRWMKDNNSYSALENNQKISGKDIVVYDAKTGQRDVLVSAEKLIPQGEKEPLLIYDYS